MIIVVIAGTTGLITFIVISEEVTLAGAAHVAFDVKIQVTISPSAKVELLNVEPVAGTFELFTCHW